MDFPVHDRGGSVWDSKPRPSVPEPQGASGLPQSASVGIDGTGKPRGQDIQNLSPAQAYLLFPNRI